MAKQTKPSAFDLKDSQLKGRWKTWADVASWLAMELDTAISARSGMSEFIRFCWDYYEQNRMRGTNAPWPDAADLPSPLAPEYTDAIHARLMQTVFVDPVWTVEGYGEAAQRAPFVEEFHQRAQEEERLQTFLDEWMLRGLVETVGTLEISEGYEMRREIARRRVKLQIDPATSQPIHGDDGPMLAQDEEGGYLDAEGEEPSAEVDVDQDTPVRLGPQYDVIPYLDFYTLPGHARNASAVWGHAKRFYKRIPQLEACAARGDYDKAAIEQLGTADEANQAGQSAPASPDPVPQEGSLAQKELYECQVLIDVDGKGERWWRFTLHKETRTLLRAKFDDRTTRYIRWMPFPKPGCVDHGYSLPGNKLITVLEEDTARRNMTADRMALKIAQPIKRKVGALWDPFEQPWSPGAVVDVREMDEVQPVQGIEDVPQSVMMWRNFLRDDGDRLIGQNDVARGVISEADSKPTATQINTTAQAAEVRVSVLRNRMQEALEELFQARHTIWKRTLTSNPDLPVDRAMVIGRDVPGVEMAAYPKDGRVTAQLLEGTFWGKPRGSVDTADPMRMRADVIGLLNALPLLTQMNPAIAQIFGTIPAAKALTEQILRVFRWPDRQSFLGSEADSVFDAMQKQQDQQREQQQLMGDPRMQLLMAAGGGMPQGAAPMAGPLADPNQAAPPMGAGMVQ